MLKLHRKPGESIMIGDDIVITLFKKLGSSNVIIGIDAPKDTPIHRKEIYDAIKKQKKQ